MADYNIKADITANTKGYEAGIKKAQESTKKFSTSVSKVIQGLGKNGLVGALGSIGLASAGLSATLGAVAKIAKQVSQAIGECTDAYKKQLIAERQLETAINNNPLVTGSAKKRLTEFASEMQKVSNYGDEELIPMMANLVSLGRTEEETMKIMAVAMDMSASGSMSLDTAITQLNATLNGNIGRLGQQNAELKGLTDEELKSGKAIEILGEKFKGLSQATLDTSKQLKNIKGDFKEAIGEFTLPTSDMWNKFWIGFYDKGISVIKQFDEYMDKTIIGKGIAEELVKGYKSISDERQKVLYLEDNIHALSETQIVALQKHLESTKNRNKEQEELLRKVKMEVESRTYLAKIYEDMDREEAERQKTEEEQLAIENEIAILKGKYLEKMAEQEAKWKNIKAVTGEEVKNEEKIKFYQDSLVDLMTQAGGQITTNNQLYKDQIAIIERLKSTLQTPEQEDSDEWAEKLRVQAVERLKAEKEIKLQELENWGATEEAKYKITKEYNDKIYALELEGMERKKQVALKSVVGTANAEEQKRQIIDYYMKEQSSLMSEYNTQYVQDMGQTGSEMGQIFSQMFGSEVGAMMDNELGILLVAMQKVGEEMKKIFAKVGEFIKGVFQNVVNISKKIFSGFKNNLKKVFEFNPDEALDGLLVFEDKVITFFIETLPKLPAFFESALQSISVMLSTVKLNIDRNKVKKLMTDLIKTIRKYLPDIVKTGLEIAREIIDGFAEGIAENKDAIGEVLDMLVNIMAEYLPDIILKIIDAISMFISTIKPETLVALVDAFVNLAKNVCIAVIDNAVMIAEKLVPALFEVMTELFKKFPEILKTVLWEAIKGLGKVAETIWNVVKGRLGFANGTNDAPRGLAMVGEAGPELVDFRGGERVINNRNTQKLLANQGNGGNVFNVTFENTVDTTAFAMMKQLKQYQRNLAFNGVL